MRPLVEADLARPMAPYGTKPPYLFPVSLSDGWPPVSPPGGDTMKISGKLPRWAVLLILVIAGLLLVWLPGFYKWQWDDGVIRGIGEAVLIGAVLAFTIDRWFREDFAKDVFYAAVGKLLRPEFRDELRWITSFKWLAV